MNTDDRTKKVEEIEHVDIMDIMEYINNIKLKKRLFGVNVEEVYDAIGEIGNLYEKEKQDYTNKLITGLEEREDAIEKEEQRVQGLMRNLGTQIDARKSDEKIISELEERVQVLSSKSAGYREIRDCLEENISGIQNLREEILEEAREEAAQILRNATSEQQYTKQQKPESMPEEHKKQAATLLLQRLEEVKLKARDSLQLILMDLYGLDEMFTTIQNEMTGEEAKLAQGYSFISEASYGSVLAKEGETKWYEKS